MSTALTTAGRYCGGGAGIQTVLKTTVLNSIFAMRAFLALLLQNTAGVSCTYVLSDQLTRLSDPARGAGADSPGRIFLFPLRKGREEQHHG